MSGGYIRFTGPVCRYSSLVGVVVHQRLQFAAVSVHVCHDRLKLYVSGVGDRFEAISHHQVLSYRGHRPFSSMVCRTRAFVQVTGAQARVCCYNLLFCSFCLFCTCSSFYVTQDTLTIHQFGWVSDTVIVFDRLQGCSVRRPGLFRARDQARDD